VLVRSASLDRSITLLGKPAFCRDSKDSAVLFVNPADSIQWFFNNQPIPNRGIRHVATQTGSYFAQLFGQEGCTVTTDPRTITIELPPKGIRYPRKFAIVNVNQMLESRNLGGPVVWRPSLFLSDTNAVQTSFRGPQDQLYYVHVQTAAGCVAVDTLQVIVVPEADIKVPTAFTPNRDGRNDVLRPVLFGMKQLNYFRIYNRWGELLFESREEERGWNGNNGADAQGAMTVVWVAEGITVDGRKIMRKGTTVLIR
jgi:gliding motility-associated-like protein